MNYQLNTKMVASLIATTLIVSGLAYAATTITSTTQTVVNNDIMSAAWFNDVNAKLASVTAGQVPSGAIMAFNLSACPTGWIAANGANGTPDLRGEFIRGLDSGRGVDSGRTLRSWQDASRVAGSAGNPTPTYLGFDNMYGYAAAAYDVRPMIQANLEELQDYTTLGDWLKGFSSYANSSSSTTTFGKVRPRNVALLYCQKQ